MTHKKSTDELRGKYLQEVNEPSNQLDDRMYQIASNSREDKKFLNDNLKLLHTVSDNMIKQIYKRFPCEKPT